MGVIGYPVKHSLSPDMHEAAYKALNLNMSYHAFEVHPDQLDAAIQGVRGLGLLGLNVTIPHKIKVMPLLDEIDDLAKEIGAVNTIVHTNGRLKGYNTDGEGYLKSLRPLIGNDDKMRALIIGAGGAARAVAITIAKYGVEEMVIANRTKEKGLDLVESCHKFSPASFMTLNEAESQLSSFQLVINTTSIGMSPNINEMPISLEKLEEDTIVSDLIYTPLKTKFLERAEEKGARILGGLDMFVYQGALAFEHWTGQEAPITEMREAVLRQLKGGR